MSRCRVRLHDRAFDFRYEETSVKRRELRVTLSVGDFAICYLAKVRLVVEEREG